MDLQENKAVNLSLAAPKINRIVVFPKETFSFWHLAGSANARKGYKNGLTIEGGAPSSGDRRRAVPDDEPAALDGFAHGADHHGASPPRWA